MDERNSDETLQIPEQISSSPVVPSDNDSVEDIPIHTSLDYLLIEHANQCVKYSNSVNSGEHNYLWKQLDSSMMIMISKLRLSYYIC